MAIARLGPYRLGARLGSGASGTVYRATGPSGGDVAVKVFHPELWDRAETERRWRREVRLGRSLTHPSLVRTLDAGVAEGERGPLRYLAMEFVDGETLRARLDRCGALDEATCRSVALGVVEALVVLHDADVIHGDVKPENVFLASDGSVRLMDLGLAWGAGPDGATTSTAPAPRGTLRYAAPEVLSGPAVEVDGRCDLYSLGLVLREARGSSPSRGLDPLLDRILHEDPARRVATTREFRALLRGEFERCPEALPHVHETRLHGRDAELSRLCARYREASEGRGRAIVLEGDAGLGKSRLLAEFLATVGAMPGDVHVLRGSYQPEEHGDVLSPYAQALRRRWGGDLLDMLERHIHVATDAGARFAEALAGDADSASALSQEAARAVLAEVLADLSTEAPTVVVVEDTHFAPAAWERTFGLLAEALAECRVLLLATTRPTPRAPGEHPRVERVALGPLSLDDIRALVEESTGVHEGSARLGDVLARASGGSPMTALELLREMRARGRLRRRAAGGWAVVGSVEDIVVPATTEALLHARLGLLARVERDVVDSMAVAGSEVPVADLAAVNGLTEEEAEATLVRVDRRYGLATSRQGCATLRHHLVRQVLLEAMPPQLAAALHDTWADRLERTLLREHADAPLRQVEACFHRLRGRRPDMAASSIASSVRILRTRLEPVRALTLARLALEIPDVLVGRDRAELLLAAAECARHVARVEEALAWANEAVEVAARAADDDLFQRVASLRVTLLLAASRAEESRAAAEELREHAERVGNRQIVAQALADLAHLEAWAGHADSALALLDAAAAATASAPSWRTELEIASRRTLVLSRSGHPQEAMREAEVACDLATRYGTAADRTHAAGRRLNLLLGRQRIAELLAAIPPALEEARRFGSDVAVANVHVKGAWANVMRRDLPAARRHAEESLRLERRAGRPALRTQALHVLLVIERLSGRLARMREVGAQARDAACHGDASTRVHIACLNAGVATLLGRHEEADTELSSTVADLGPTDAYLAVEVDMARGNLAWARGVPERAMEEWRRALNHAREASSAAYRVLGVRCQLALSCLETRRPGEALELARAAKVDAQSAEQPFARTLPLALLALLGEAPIAEAEEALGRAPDHPQADMLVHHLLWRAGAGAEHARAGRRLLESLQRDAPPEDRDRMVRDVALHRAIVAAHPAAP